jgi:short-subunit dehydrogenase
MACEVFEINKLGTIAVTHARLSRFRQRNAGVIANVMLAVTLKPLPLL